MPEDRQPSSPDASARAPLRSTAEGALNFAQMFLTTKYALMERLFVELQAPLDPQERPAVRARFQRVLARGERALRLRLVVNVLLAFGLVTTLFSATARLVTVPPTAEVGVAATRTLLDLVAAFSASFAAALIALRLAFDRYLSRIDVSATFLAMRLLDDHHGGREDQ